MGNNNSLPKSIHNECARDNINVVRRAIKKGMNLKDLKNELGDTPLHSVCARHWKTKWNNEIEIVKLLLDAGCDINAINDFGETPLHYASAGNARIELIKLLVENGADVNAKDFKNGVGNTPLHIVYKTNKNQEIIDYLISKGADTSAKNNEGKTPIESILTEED